nr:ribonuclease H [Tanacetum cinerariifolium]
MPTKIELTLEQSQQGASNDISVSIEGVEELKRNVWIKGENKATLPTLKAETGSIHMLSVFTKVENGVIELYFVNTEYQLADLFTKALGRDRIEFLINKLGMSSFTPETLKQLTDEVDE